MKIRNGKKKQSKSLLVKPIAKDDLEFWIALYEDSEAKRQLYAVPSGSRQALWDYLQTEQKAFTVWKMGHRIGGFLLSKIASSIGTFSVVIHSDFRSKGYGRDVMNLIELQAVREGYRTLRADVYTDNLTSVNLLEKCGFRRFIWLEKNL